MEALAESCTSVCEATWRLEVVVLEEVCTWGKRVMIVQIYEFKYMFLSKHADNYSSAGNNFSGDNYLPARK